MITETGRFESAPERLFRMLVSAALAAIVFSFFGNRVVSATGPPAPPPAGPVAISGHVTIQKTGDPVAGVGVRLLGPGPWNRAPTRERPSEVTVAVTRTLADGAFSLEAPERGSYRLSVDEPAFFPVEQDVYTSRGGLITGIKLHLLRVPVLNLAITAPDGTPVSGVPAEVWLLEAPLIHTSPVPSPAATETRTPGTTPALAPTPNHNPAPAARAYHSPTYAQARWLALDRVLDGRLSVTTRRVGVPYFPLGSMDSRLLFGSVPGEWQDPGPFGISIRVPGIGFATVTAPSWPTETIPIRLQTGTAIAGTVVGADGKPAANTPVVVSGAAPGLSARFMQGWARATTDANGAFSVSNLAPGRYEVRARYNDGARYQLINAGPGSAPSKITAEDRTGPPMNFFDNMRSNQSPFPRALFDWNDPAPPVEGSLEIQGPLFPAPGTGIHISGRVQNREAGGRPVAGIPVVLYGSDRMIISGAFKTGYEMAPRPTDLAISGPGGSVELTVPTPGAYNHSAGWGWYHDYAWMPTQFLSVEAGGLKDQVWEVYHRPAIRVRVLDLTGRPVVGQPVQISGLALKPKPVFGVPDGYNLAYFGPTDANGITAARSATRDADTDTVESVDLSVSLRGTGTGHVHLNGWPIGLVDVRLPEDTAPAAPAIGGTSSGTSGPARPPIELKVGGSRALQGRVIGPTALAVEGGSVKAELVSGQQAALNVQRTGFTAIATDGRFTLTGLQPGLYFLIASLRDGREVEVVADARSPTPAAVTIRFDTGLSISGRVLGEDGTPCSDVPIRVQRIREQRSLLDLDLIYMPNIKTDAAGAFRVDSLSSGAYVIAAEPPHGSTGSAFVDVAPGKLSRVTIRTHSQFSVIVRVLDALGHPVPKAPVNRYWVSTPDPIPGWSMGRVTNTDPAGRCTLENLERGRYILVATIPDVGDIHRLVTLDKTTTEITLRPDGPL